MSDNVIKLPDGLADMEVTSGDPCLSDYCEFNRAGWVGLAKTESCEDDEGKVTLTINFEPAFVTVREAATLLRVAPSTIRSLIAQKKLDRQQFGSEHRITWESLVAVARIETRPTD
jgi:excisionase family DNA binding protein